MFKITAEEKELIIKRRKTKAGSEEAKAVSAQIYEFIRALNEAEDDFDIDETLDDAAKLLPKEKKKILKAKRDYNNAAGYFASLIDILGKS